MKQRFTLFGLILWAMIFLQTDLYAQRSQTQCPPRAKAWKNKSSKSLAKFPQLVKKEKKEERLNAKEMRRYKEPPKVVKVKAIQPQQAKYREQPQPVKKEKVQPKRIRENYYVKERGGKRQRAQRVATNRVASVDCPR